MLDANYSSGYSAGPGFLGIGAESQLDHRYLTEDVGYSLVFLTDLAGRVRPRDPQRWMRSSRWRRSCWLETFARRGEANLGHPRPGRHERQ